VGRGHKRKKETPGFGFQGTQAVQGSRQVDDTQGVSCPSTSRRFSVPCGLYSNRSCRHSCTCSYLAALHRWAPTASPQPLFYFSGTMLWTFFATTLQKCSDTFVNNAGLFGKVYFPRFTMPIAYVVNAFFTLCIQFAVMMIFYVYYFLNGFHFTPTWWIVVTPLYIFQLALLGMGFGIMTSALTTKYRDLRNLVSFGLSLLMYATPVVYPISSVPIKWKLLFQINPVTPIIEMFRFSFFGNGNYDIRMWIYSFVVSVVVFLIGLMTFNHNEQTFIDVV